MEKIGQGAYATVFQRGRYAIKVMEPKRIGTFMRELSIATLVKHPNIQSVKSGSISPEGHYSLKMTLASYDLRQYIKYYFQEGNQSLTDEIISDIIRGVAYLHANNIMHFDISTRNALCYPQRSDGAFVKIADFGCSTVVRQPFIMKSKIGNRIGRSLELYEDDETGSNRPHWFYVDVWALGVVLCQVLKKDIFYSIRCEKSVTSEVPKKVKELVEKFPIPEKYSIIKECFLPFDDDKRTRVTCASLAKQLFGETWDEPKMYSEEASVLNPAALCVAMFEKHGIPPETHPQWNSKLDPNQTIKFVDTCNSLLNLSD